MFLCLGATLDECASENFGASDQRTADAKGCTREFFGSDATCHVFAVAALAETAIFAGDRKAEGTDIGETRNYFFGHVKIFAVNMFGVWRDYFASKTAKCILNHFVIAI